MPRILSLETSTSICSAAVHDKGNLVALAEIHEDQAHAAKLALLINEVLEASSTQPMALEAVAVSSGPGSYTGLRIGVSTAKGICFANNIPLLAVDSLQLTAWKVVRQKNLRGLFCPLFDARRMEVYCALYDENLKQIQPAHARIIDSTSFQEELREQNIYFFGNGAFKCQDTIRHLNASFISDIHPSAAELGELAWNKFQHNQVEDLIHFEPHYLKEFQVKKASKVDGVLNK